MKFSIKEIAVEYPKIFSLIIIGFFLVGLSGILIFHPMSQYEVFTLPSVWRPCTDRVQFYNDLIGNNFTSFASVPATDFFYHGTVGQLMDLMLTLTAIGWIMGMMGVAFIGLGFIMLMSQRLKILNKELEGNKSLLSNNKSIGSSS
jgi:hypothetical protein